MLNRLRSATTVNSLVVRAVSVERIHQNGEPGLTENQGNAHNRETRDQFQMEPKDTKADPKTGAGRAEPWPIAPNGSFSPTHSVIAAPADNRSGLSLCCPATTAICAAGYREPTLGMGPSRSGPWLSRQLCLVPDLARYENSAFSGMWLCSTTRELTIQLTATEECEAA